MRANRGIARGLRIHLADGVRTTGRAFDTASSGTIEHARATTAEVLSQRGADHVVRAVLAVFQRPLLDRTVDQAEVIDTSIFASRFASFDEVRDGDRSEEADDGHHDHDFNERKARLARGLNFHTTCVTFLKAA